MGVIESAGRDELHLRAAHPKRRQLRREQWWALSGTRHGGESQGTHQNTPKLEITAVCELLEGARWCIDVERGGPGANPISFT